MSRDGREYTLPEFLDWYGYEYGHQRWQEASVAGATPPPQADAESLLILLLQQQQRRIEMLEGEVRRYQQLERKVCELYRLVAYCMAKK